MPCHLRREEVVSIQVLARKGMRKTAIARILGVTEGAVRHHLRRLAEGREDGRVKPFRAEFLADRIRAWHEVHEKEREGRCPVKVRDLYEHLVAEADYTGSYNWSAAT
jgi:predicted transcriptional regulator